MNLQKLQCRNFLSQPLWNNVFTKIENKSVFYRSQYIKNLCYVNDLVDESGSFSPIVLSVHCKYYFFQNTGQLMYPGCL